MERNSNTAGGDDSNSKDIIHEDGVIDEFTLPSLCPGAITFSGYSARTGKVEGALCDNPIYCYPEPGVAGSETATVVREGPQVTEEYGESSNPSGEQDS